jgi:hypothetical protein
MTRATRFKRNTLRGKYLEMSAVQQALDHEGVDEMEVWRHNIFGNES